MATTKEDEASNGGQSGPKAASGDPVNPPAVQDSSEDPTAFILSRARSEVHLLLDNISANPDVTIAALTALAPPKGLPEDWIEQVCEITWPRRDGQSGPEDLAKQAALLIRTRDYLNGLARPASGATIAFTLMVTQDTDAKARRRRRAESGSFRSPSRTSLAAEAYPDLVERARSFRDLLKWTVIFSAGILIVTLLISWYLAVGNAALADFQAARIALDEADVRVGAAQSSLSGRSGPIRVVAPSARRRPPDRPSAPRPGARPSKGLRAGGKGGAGTRRRAPPARRGGSACRGGATPPTQPRIRPSSRRLRWVNPCHDRAESYAAQLREACQVRAVRAAASSRYARARHMAVGASPETASWLANLLGSGVLRALRLLGASRRWSAPWRKIKAAAQPARRAGPSSSSRSARCRRLLAFHRRPGGRQRHLAARAGRTVERSGRLRRRLRGGFGVQGAGGADLQDLQPRPGGSRPDAGGPGRRLTAPVPRRGWTFAFA